MSSYNGRRLHTGIGRAWKMAGFVLAVLLAITIHFHGNALAQSGSTYRVGIYNYEPLVFIDQNGFPAGLYVEMLNYVAEKEGWTLEYVPCNFSECITALQVGKLDIFPGVGYTEERDQLMDFTSEYLFLDWGVAYQRENQSIQTVLDLQDKKIAVLQGSLYTIGLENLLDQFGVSARIVQMADYQDVLVAVNAGDVDAGVVTQVYGLVWEHQYPNIKSTDIFFSPVKIHFAFPNGKNSGLRLTLNRYFASLKSDPISFYHQSLNKWTGRYQQKDSRLPTWVTGVFVVAVLLVMAFAIFSFLLRRQVQQKTRALRESQDNLKALIENTDDSIWSVDRQYRLLAGNSIFLENVRAADGRNMLLGDYVLANYPDDVQAEWRRYYDRALNGEYFSVDVRRTRFTHEERYAEYRIGPIRDSDGRVTGVTIFGRDVTHRKQAENKIRQSEERYQLIFENSGTANAIFDLECRLILQNSLSMKFLGTSPGEALGKLPHEFLGAKIGLDVEERLRQVMRSGEAKSFETGFDLPAGKGWFHSTYQPIFNDRAEVLGVQLISQDITGRRRAEESQRRSEEQFRKYFELGMVGMAITSPEKGWMQFNDRLCEMLGYAREELSQITWAQLTHPADLDADVQQFNRVMAGEIDGYQLDKRFIQKDGGVLYTSLSVNALRREDGSVEHFSAVLMDITGRKQMEMALRDSEIKLRAIFENSRDAIGVSRQGKHYLANPAYVSMFGYENADELIGTPILNLIAPESRDTVLAYVQARAQGEPAPVSYEATAQRRDGSKFIMETHVALFEQGGEQFTLVMLRDITERKLAELSLQESQERFSWAMDASQDGLWDWDVQTGAVYYSPAYFTMLGYPPTGFPKTVQSWIDLIHPDDLERTLLANTRCIENFTERFEIEFRFRAQDGSWRWILGKGTAVKRDENGRALRMVGTHTDITERKQAAEKLGKLFERFNLATHAAHLGVWDWDIVNNVLEWDDQMYAIYGVSRDHFTGAYEAWLAGVHPSDRARSEETSLLARLGKRNYDTEFRIVWPNGEIRFIKAYGMVIWDTNQQAVRMTGVNYDITDLKLAEALLRDNEILFRGIFESSAVGIALVSTTGYWLKVNPRVLEILGYSGAELMRTTFQELTYPDDLEKDLEHVRLMLAKQIQFYEMEKRYIHKNGSIIWALLSVSLIWREDGEPLYFISQIQDITKRKQAEDQIRWNAELTTALAALYLPITRLNSTIKDVAREVLTQATRLTDSNLGYVSEISLETGENMVHAVLDIPTSPERLSGKMPPAGSLRDAGENYAGPWGNSINTRQAFYSNNPASHPATSEMPNQHIQIERFLSVPVMLGDDVVGQISLANAPREYVDRDLDGIRRLAEFYALAIQRKRIEAEINHLSSFPEQNPHPIIETDRNGKIIYFNPAFKRASEMLGIDSSFSFIPPNLQEIIHELHTNITHRKYEEINISERWYGVDASWVDEFNTLRLYYSDVTERRNAEEQVHSALREREILLRELYHRTKNNMQVISSMLNLEVAQTDSEALRHVLLDMDGRIHSMSLVHQKLYQSKSLSTLDLKDYITDLAALLLESYQIMPGKINILFEIEPIPVLIDTAIPCGLIVNEILSNAFKYAFPAERTGEIKIRLSRPSEHQITLEIADNGVGVHPGEDIRHKNTLGVQTIIGIATHQLGASVELDTNHGVAWKIEFSDDKYRPRV